MSFKTSNFKLVGIFACVIALCLALAGCAGGTGSSAAASGESSAADPAAKFVGPWKVAAAQVQGVTVTGDFGALLDETYEFNFELAADGTGTVTYNDESGDITWELVDDDTITIIETTVGSEETYEANLADGALSIETEDSDMTVTVMFTPDGVLQGMPQITASNAKAITSEDELVGTWNLCGVNMDGAMMFGDAESLSELAGMGTSATFEKGGSVTFMDTDLQYAVSSDGAVITGLAEDVSVKKLGEDLIIDFSNLMDGSTMYLLLEK